MAFACIRLYSIPPSMASYLYTGVFKIQEHYACNILTTRRRILQKSSSRVYTVKYGTFYLHCQPLLVTPTWRRDHFSDVFSARIPNVLKVSPILRIKSEIHLI